MHCFSSRSGSRTGIQLTSIFLALAKKSNGHSCRPINVNRLRSWVEHYVPTDLLVDVVGSPLVLGLVFF